MKKWIKDTYLWLSPLRIKKPKIENLVYNEKDTGIWRAHFDTTYLKPIHPLLQEWINNGCRE